MRETWPDAAIDVVLPRQGPITAALAPFATRILIEPLWILRRRDLGRLATVGLLRLPLAVGRALARMRRSDLVYVNTSVVADYLLAARLFRRRCIVHIHEIPEGPVRTVLRLLLGWSACATIFNSRATERTFPGLAGRVVYNGIADPGLSKPMTYRGERPLRLLMLGRISRIKGQEILVEAMRSLPDNLRRRVNLRIVGSAFEDAERERALATRIAEADLGGCVTLHPFVPDPSEHFRWADVVVIPSCMPESLGRVAIEAMAYGIPPVVSDIGGLPEVVDDGRTGWLVPPGDAAALAACIATLVTRPEAWAGFPAAARERYVETFAESASAAGMVASFRDVLSRRGRVAHEGRGKPANCPIR